MQASAYILEGVDYQRRIGNISGSFWTGSKTES